MEYTISRSEQKRRAKAVEDLANELIALKPAEIRDLPCDDFLRKEILAAQGLKGGALKRQGKYIAKNLRQEETDPLFDFLERRKGSRLKEAKEFQVLERLRDDILTDAIQAFEEVMNHAVQPDDDWQSAALAKAVAMFPDLDAVEIKNLANRYARTRKPALRKEIFRAFKSAAERRKFAPKPATDETDGD